VSLATLPQAGCPANGAATAYDNDPSYYNAAAYARDPNGFVHLRGLVKVCNVPPLASKVVFILPPGFRPLRHEGSGGFVAPNGQVTTDNANPFYTYNLDVELDGFTFRCAPSGANGCP
jgi:hypothetical protein